MSTTVLPVTRNAAAPAGAWRTHYARRILLTDLIAIVTAVAGSQLIWFGPEIEEPLKRAGSVELAVSYTVVSAILAVGWFLSLHFFGTREGRVIGSDLGEYKRVIVASMSLFGLLAIASYLLQIELARGYFITALPFGTLLLLASRFLWRTWLARRRAAGEYSYRAVVVGSLMSAMHLAQQLRRNPGAGYTIVGAVVPGATGMDVVPGTTIPLRSDLGRLLDTMDETGADTVALTGSDAITPEKVRELSWSLEPSRRHLVVVPSLTDVGGPRIHMRPVAGLPLIHVETPIYEGRKLYTKRGFDVVAAIVLLLLLAPVMVVIAALVKFTSPGPILFGQERVGKNGERFTMLKFRSMVADAEARLVALTDRQTEVGNSVMFKMKDDPRVTRVGRLLRRFSLDELPQLFNVLGGEMSLVGPRPPLPQEVELYESNVHRRFLVKPGITGLWQVSGRSHLSWEDTVRLDLYYVENWSLTTDLVVLWRTFKAVVGSTGAY